MKRVRAISLLVLLCPVMIVHAQTKDILISGKVVSNEGYYPLEGVNVVVKGTRTITGTMVDGSYTLPVKPNDSVLVFSLEGYELQEVKIEPDRKEYNIILKNTNGVAVIVVPRINRSQTATSIRHFIPASL